MGTVVPVSEVTKQLEARGWSLAQVLEKALLFRDPRGNLYPVRLHPTRPGVVDLAELAGLLGPQNVPPFDVLDEPAGSVTGAPEDEPDAKIRREEGYRTLKEVAALPASPEVALEIMRLTRADVGPQAIADVVKRDPTIAGTVLEQANSAAVRPVAPINDLVRAVHHLGPKWIQGLAFKCSVISRHRAGPCAAFDYERFWQESMARAVACARMTRWGDHRFTAEEAWAAGLLSQIGRLAFATALPDDYAGVLEKAGTDEVRLVTEELAAFRLDHYEVAGEMIRDWGLASFFWQAILFQASEGILLPSSPAGGLAATLSWSDLIWAIFERRGHGIERGLREQAMDSAGLLGMPRDEFGAEFDAIGDEWEWLGSLLEVTTFDVRPWAEIDQDAA